MSIVIQLPDQQPEEYNGRVGRIISEFIRQLVEAAAEDAGIANPERNLKFTINCTGQRIRLTYEKY